MWSIFNNCAHAIARTFISRLRPLRFVLSKNGKKRKNESMLEKNKVLVKAGKMS